VDRVNQSRPGNEAPLQTVELHARGLDAFSRSLPSIAATAQLPDWEQSERMVWPPPRIPIGVLVAQRMQPVHDTRYTDRWHEAQDQRRAEQEAEQQRISDFHANQQRLKEEREAAEACATPPRAS
jgi:hypothetical protein